jgi:hypothetical protein
MRDRRPHTFGHVTRASGGEFERGRIEIQQAVDAVCDELGIPAEARARRAAVAEGVTSAYRLGRRQPLYLVDAGLVAAN